MKGSVPPLLTSRLLLVPVAAVLLYTLIGFFLLPCAARWYLPKVARDRLQCLLEIGEVKINPYLFTLEARAFSLRDPDGNPMASFDRLFVDLQLSGINHWLAAFKQIRLEKPSVFIAIEPDGRINLQKLLPEREEPEDPASRLFRMVLQRLELVDGSVEIVDRRQSTPAEFKVEALNLHLKDFSTLQGHDGVYSLLAHTTDGETIEWQGRISLSPLFSSGRLAFKGILAKTLWAFTKDRVNIEPPDGILNVESKYRLDAGSNPAQLILEGIEAGVSDLSLRLTGSGKPFLELKRIKANAPSFDTRTGEFTVDEIVVDGGAVDIQTDASGSTSFDRILHKTSSKDDNSKEAVSSESAGTSSQEPTTEVPVTAPFRLQARSIQIKNVALDVSDSSRSVPIKAKAAELDLSLKASIETGAKGIQLSLEEIVSEIKEVRLGSPDTEEPSFRVTQLIIDEGEFDLGSRFLKASRIVLRDGHVDLILDKEGQINWMQLAGRKSSPSNPSEVKAAPSGGSPWKFLVKTIQLESFRSAVSDLTALPDKPLLNLQNIRVELNDVDGQSPIPFKIALEVQEGGSAQIHGKLDPSAGSLETKIDATGLVLTPLQPYLEPHITLTLRSMDLSAQGNLRYGSPADGPRLVYEGGMTLHGLSLSESHSKETYMGFETLQIPRLKITLEPNRVEADQITIRKPVGELIIAEDGSVNLTKIMKKGESSVKTAAKTPSASGAGQDFFPFQIGRINVENGNIFFADLSLRPKFSSRIHALKGIVMGISSCPDTQAKVQLDGRVDQFGLAKISGILNLCNPKRSTDIDMVFRNVEMANLSPYSGKFAGHRIRSGKLSMDLKYKIQNSKLFGDNKIIVDKLVLGERVESPDAVDLPLRLAVALLQDSKGRIDIGLPVSGDLDNPQFELGPIIWKAFTNLLKKIVTAPFRALGSMFGKEDEEFNTVVFEAGNFDLLPSEKEKLKNLAALLKKRPQLKLVVQGQYSPEADGAAYRDLSLRRAVFRRMGARIEADSDPGPLDFSDSKVRGALEDIYEERMGKNALKELEEGVQDGSIKPQNLEKEKEEKGKDKKGPYLSRVVDRLKLYKVIPGVMSSEQSSTLATEIYIRLLDSEPVPDEALEKLAVERGRAITQEMERAHGVPKDRLAVGDPEALPLNAEPTAKLTLDALSAPL